MGKPSLKPAFQCCELNKYFIYQERIYQVRLAPHEIFCAFLLPVIRDLLEVKDKQDKRKAALLKRWAAIQLREFMVYLEELSSWDSFDRWWLLYLLSDLKTPIQLFETQKEAFQHLHKIEKRSCPAMAGQKHMAIA